MKQCGLPVVLFFSFFLVACGGNSGSAGKAGSNSPINVDVEPTTATVPTGGIFSGFVASVSGTSNTSVTWMVDSIAGGNVAIGTIDSSGRYTAPSAPGNHTITAVSMADATRSGNAQVTVAREHGLSPSTATVLVGTQQQFTATVAGTPSPQLQWTVDGIAGGNSSVGTIDGTGLYTAPAASGVHTIEAASNTGPDGDEAAEVVVVVPDFGPVSVLTYHNDGQRTGLNENEAVLNPANVNAAGFGKQFSYPVDGQIYAQPLYVSGLSNIAGGTHDVIFVATEHNSVYAFDADGLSSHPLWHKNFGASIPSASVEGVSPEIGITSTPVIDGTTDTLYVVTQNQGGVFRLHALGLHDGSEKFGGPAVVAATASGTGQGSLGGTITLESSCLQRSGLALVNGVVFIAFGSCPHGWLVGYNAKSLQQVSKLNTTPNGAGGAIWMGGGAPAVDTAGNLYLITGVDFGDPASGYNDTFLKLNSADLLVLDLFTPSNEAFLRANDADLGSGAPMVLPDNNSAHRHELVGGGKDGRVFVLDRDHLGGFTVPTNPACDGTSTPPASCDNVVETIPDIGTTQFDNIFGTPAYFNGRVYYHPESGTLQAFSYSDGMLSRAASASTIFGDHGATPSVSSRGTSGGIVWELQDDAWKTGSPAVLRAYDAGNVAHELYNSSQAAGGRDTAGPAVKFTTPTIANGRVYVGTANQLDVYGLFSR